MVARRLMVIAVAGVMTTALFAAPMIAQADSSSTVARAPLPSGAVSKNQNATLNAVSCPGLNTCTAVGSYRSASGPVPLIENEVDGVWQTPLTVALPSSAVGSSGSAARQTALYAVSCPRSGECLAVGTVVTASGNQPLLVTEKKGAWSTAVIAALPGNARTSTQVAALLGASCNSPGNCAAVGTYVTAANNVEPWAMSERSGTWFAPVVPSLPTGALTVLQDATLNAVACHSVGNCTAVGSFVDANDTQLMALTETKGVWGTTAQAATIAVPADAAQTGNDSFNGLNSVACPGAASCVAVGQYATSHGYAALAVNEANGVWPASVSVTTPPPLGSAATPVADLQSVSCASNVACVAVGASGSDSESFPVVSTFSGATWSDGVASPTPSSKVPVTNQFSQALSVADFGVGQILIVGRYAMTSGTQGFTATPTTVADPPQHVVVTSHNGAATVSWVAPNYTGDVALTGYTASATPGHFECTTTTARQCTIGKLVNGTTYRVTVIALNGVGPSRPSSAVDVTPATTPSAPTISTVHPLAGGFQLVLSAPASNGGAPLLSYEYSLNGGSSWHHRASGTTSRILTITGLRARHTYSLAVRAINRAGNGAPSPVVSATTH